jgi:hypothetical protein
MSRSYELDGPADVLKPLAWVAGLAFATGFCGYLAVAWWLGF